MFVTREKASKVSVPCNDYGFEQAKDGKYYAGFRAYSKSSKLKRSYLQVQLTEMLEEDQVYCVSFDLSLAERLYTMEDSRLRVLPQLQSLGESTATTLTLSM